mmetsp:Transcript_42284/g.92114  ORF Transcript_42284/g.92114 Transcript_42284/m.92114 type:complete len:117 (-) Transcript_42284:14-364(-)
MPSEVFPMRVGAGFESRLCSSEKAPMNDTRSSSSSTCIKSSRGGSTPNATGEDVDDLQDPNFTELACTKKAARRMGIICMIDMTPQFFQRQAGKLSLKRESERNWDTIGTEETKLT